MTIFVPKQTTDTTTSSVNLRIKQALREKRVTQKDLAVVLGVERETVTRHLTGKDCNSIVLLRAVHDLTGANYQWLLEGDGDAYPPTEAQSYQARLQRQELLNAFQDKLEEEFKKRGL